MKVKCNQAGCGWRGIHDPSHSAPDPSDPDDEISICPACGAARSLSVVCDQPGCWEPVAVVTDRCACITHRARDPFDSGLGQGSVRFGALYRSTMADALLPGQDPFTRLLRSDFSEMLAQHLDAGGEPSLIAIGSTLADFTPQRVSGVTHPAWNERAQQDWAQRDRPQLFAAMEAFFLNGGFEARTAEQSRFLLRLRENGVRFGNERELVDAVLHAGDWRKEFVQLVETGRPRGIQLTGDSVDRSALVAAMQAAGFAPGQQHVIEAHLLPLSSPRGSESTTALWLQKPRYCAGAPGSEPVYQGDSRVRAWFAWLRGRRQGVVAFDRLSWIIDPTYWLRGEAPPAGFFATNPKS